MKLYVSVDMEGLPAITSVSQVLSTGKDYDRARKWMTELINIVASTAFSYGFKEVYVNDAHGLMTNILYEKLAGNTYLVSGFPKPVSMMCGIDGSFDAAIFLGYHAKKGTEHAVMDHTMSSKHIQRIIVNGVEASEFYLNAAVAGYYGVPVILVGGDDKIVEEARKIIRNIEIIEFKKSIGRFSSISPALKNIEVELREKCLKAFEKLRNGLIKPFKIKEPVTLEVEFVNSAVPEVLEALATIKRDGLRVKVTTENIVKAYRLLELFLIVAVGVS
ncbi:MAG: peptide transporter, partial [Thermoprotei archaeon]